MLNSKTKTYSECKTCSSTKELRYFIGKTYCYDCCIKIKRKYTIRDQEYAIQLRKHKLGV